MVQKVFELMANVVSDFKLSYFNFLANYLENKVDEIDHEDEVRQVAARYFEDVELPVPGCANQPEREEREALSDIEPSDIEELSDLESSKVSYDFPTKSVTPVDPRSDGPNQDLGLKTPASASTSMSISVSASAPAVTSISAANQAQYTADADQEPPSSAICTTPRASHQERLIMD
ncbi:hypothetical protein TRVA0_009S02454 [Trichomonascus vanleenenianus]|uniref:uncharacterized protein n=1 Tax=Trichomonascus vanleenenianus TaxID=2268995 RepID=UPI003EC99A44